MASTQIKDEAKLQDTRQLLDELDALMDQMLALPIDDPAEADVPAPTPPGPTPTVSATLTMLDTYSTPAADAAPTDRPTHDAVVNDSAGAQAEAPPAGDSTATDSEAVPVPVLTDVAAPAPLDLTPLPPVVKSSRWRPDHISYQFLLWVNQGYEHGTTWLGAPGRFLRSRNGKMTLGVTGLALLGGALAWLARDVLGWNW